MYYNFTYLNHNYTPPQDARISESARGNIL